MAPITTTQVYLSSQAGIDRYTAKAVPRTALDGALRYRVRAGSLADLTGDTIAATTTVAAARDWRVGDSVAAVHLDDGTETHLRLVAIVAGGGGYDSLPAFLLPTDRVTGHIGPCSTTHALITVEPGTDPGTIAAALSTRLAQHAVAIARSQWLDRTLDNQFEGNQTFLLAILTMAAAYTTIAIANTLVMAVRERIPDITRLRLTGATRRQARGMLLWEGGLAAAVGACLGLAVTATATAATTVAARTVNPDAQPAMPWPTLVAIAAGGVAVVLIATIAASISITRSGLPDGLTISE